MAVLVTVIRLSDMEELTVDITTAKAMKEANELYIAPNTGDALTHQDLFGADYDPDAPISRI